MDGYYCCNAIRQGAVATGSAPAPPPAELRIKHGYSVCGRSSLVTGIVENSGARSLIVPTKFAFLVPNLPPHAGPRAESFTRITTVVQARSATIQAHRFALPDLSQNRRHARFPVR